MNDSNMQKNDVQTEHRESKLKNLPHEDHHSQSSPTEDLEPGPKSISVKTWMAIIALAVRHAH